MNTDLGQKIAVCMLTYNHAHLLQSTLASIQQQSVTGYEIIVSDDHSTDGSWDLLQDLAGADPRIRPICTPKNLGMPGNANFAVAQTDRPYIALLHHDDLCRPDLLEQWASALERHPDASFVFNSYGVENSDFVWRESLPGERLDGRWLLEHYLFPRWGCLIRGTAMIRRSAWQQVGGMQRKFGLLADVDLWMRLAMLGPVAYVDSPVLILRQDRPENYPTEYQYRGWSWLRKRYLYEIHAANRKTYYSLNTLPGRWNWWVFRMRLSLETAKWITYALIRRKPEMIATSGYSVTDYDLIPLRIYRRLVYVILGGQRRF
jgi:GT2 family glycosyltransferase